MKSSRQQHVSAIFLRNDYGWREMTVGKMRLGGALCCGLVVCLGLAGQAAWAEGTTGGNAGEGSAMSDAVGAALEEAMGVQPEAGAKATPPAGQPSTTTAKPGKGPVTNLPLPRYVTLKPGKAFARRGPGPSHRIDWVFVRAGMPLRVTAEYEHWRRVEDAEGFGGWVHYTRLTGSRAALIAVPMAELRSLPDPAAPVVLKAERNVTAKVLKCGGGWCRLNIGGEKGWLETSALWGVEPGEIIE